MNNEAVPYYIQQFKLVLRPVGGGLRLEQSEKAWKDPSFATTIQHHREDIVAELQRRVQPLAIKTADGESDLNPMRHAEPAIARMERAMVWVLRMVHMGRPPRVVYTPDGGIWVTDQDASRLEHPIGCLPEVIWHIRREFPPDTAGLRWAHNRTSGGVA